MDRKYWKLDEVVKLKNAIAKYKQAHGNAPIAWNYVREESNVRLI
jgi:hypothetical protein